MDGSGFGKFPIGLIFWLSIFGLVSAALILLGGLGFAAWWIINHVQIG